MDGLGAPWPCAFCCAGVWRLGTWPPLLLAPALSAPIFFTSPSSSHVNVAAMKIACIGAAAGGEVGRRWGSWVQWAQPRLLPAAQHQPLA